MLEGSVLRSTFRQPSIQLSALYGRRSAPASDGLSFYGPRGVMVHGTHNPPRVPEPLNTGNDSTHTSPQNSLLVARVDHLYQQNNVVNAHLDFMSSAIVALANAAGVSLPPARVQQSNTDTANTDTANTNTAAGPGPWTPAPTLAAPSPAPWTQQVAPSSAVNGTPAMPSLGDAAPVPVPGQENPMAAQRVVALEEAPQKVSQILFILLWWCCTSCRAHIWLDCHAAASFQAGGEQEGTW